MGPSLQKPSLVVHFTFLYHNCSSSFSFLIFSALLKHVVRDLVYDGFNRGYVLQVLKPFKSKSVAKSHVPLTKVFTETVTYVKVERKIEGSIKMTS